MLKLTLFPLLLPLLLSHTCLAQKVGVCSDLGLACWSAAAALNFGCPAPDSLPPREPQPTSSVQVDPISAYKCLCSSAPFLQTYAYCIRSRMQEYSQISGGYLFLYRQCFYNADTAYSLGHFEDLYYNASSYISSQEYNNDLSVLTSTPHFVDTAQLMDALVSSQSLLEIPVAINNDTFSKQFKAASIAKTQYRMGSVYGTLLLCYWGLIIAVASIHRFIQQVYPEILFANNKQVNYLRKYLILPATFKRNRSRPVKLLLSFYVCAPTRGQSLILVGYFVLTTVFLSIRYDIYQGNPITPGPKYQLLKYLGSRSGIMAFTQLPLVISFAARNSPLIWLTGWPYDTFQTYHRWTARVMMINILLHTACFMTIAVSGCTWVYRWEEIINWRFGNLATYSGVIMALVAINKFRAHFYETFLVIHKLFFFAFMVGIFRHCWDFGWMPWVYASIAIYFSERLGRIFKTTVSGVVSSAYAEVYEDNVFRLTVHYSGRWNVQPGQYCYIRFLRRDLFWQAHPISVYAGPQDAGFPTLQFCVQAHNGATKTIAEHLAQQPDKNGKLRVMVQGPYGVPQKIEVYDTVIFVAGGLGITAVYSYAQHLKRLGSSHQRQQQRVVVMWIVRSTAALEWFSEELAELGRSSYGSTGSWFDTQVYVTDSQSRSASQVDLSAMQAHVSGVTENNDEADERQPSQEFFPDLEHCETLTEARMQRDDSEATLSLEELDNVEIGGRHYSQYPSQHDPQQAKRACIHSITTASSTSSLGAALHLPVKPSIIQKQRPESFAVPLTPTLDMREYQRYSVMQLQQQQEEEEPLSPKPIPKTPTTPYGMQRFALSDQSLSSELFNMGPLPSDRKYGLGKLDDKKGGLSNTSRIGAANTAVDDIGVTRAPGFTVIHGKPDVRSEIARCLRENIGRRPRSAGAPGSLHGTGSVSASGNPYGFMPGMSEQDKSSGSRNGFCREGGCFKEEEKHVEYSEEKKSMGKPLAVMSCGPPELVDSIRASIVEHLLDSEGRVDYFEEAFSW